MKWIKESGLEIETNDLKDTIEYCKSLGWKQADDAKTPEEAPKKKAGRPKKEE